MSETCIVCLGDLGESAHELPHPGDTGAVKSTNGDHGGLVPRSSTTQLAADDANADMIAHLLPCGHNLHNECLKPWVERANSCPICRQSFNQVELKAHIEGKFLTITFALNPRLRSTHRFRKIMVCRERSDSSGGCRSIHAH